MIIHALATIFSVDEIYDNICTVLNDERFQIVIEGRCFTQESFDKWLATMQYIQEQSCFNYDAWKKLDIAEGHMEIQLTMPALQPAYDIAPSSYEPQPFINIRFEPEFSHHIGTEKDFICFITLHNYKYAHIIDNHLSSLVLEDFFKLVPPIYAWHDDDDSLCGRLPDSSDYIKTPDSPYYTPHGYEEQRRNLHEPWRIYRETMIFGPTLVSALRLDEINWEIPEIWYKKWVTPELLWIASHQGFKSTKLEEDPYEYFYRYNEEHTRHIEAIQRLYDCMTW